MRSHPFRATVLAWLALLLAVFSLRAPSAQAAASKTSNDDLARYADQLFSQTYPADEPGAAVLVMKDGQVVLRKGYGMADLELGVPIQPDQVFEIGSITKQLTAAGIFLLVDEGKLALEDEITKHLPDYPTKGRRITIHHLLTHSSGIRSYTDLLVEPSTLTLDKTVREVIDDFKDEPLYFEPGEAIRYSNSNSVLLGAIIEKVSGMTYADFMAKRVFEPLGMESTAYEGHERNGRKRVEGYQRGRNKPFEKALPISMTQTYAAGALVSSVDDLAKWGAAINSGGFLTAASWKRMLKPFVLNSGEVTKVCSGWFVERIAFGREVYGHAGGINGFASMLYWVPEDRVFVVVLLNHSGQNVGALHVAQLMLHVSLPRRD